MKFAPLMTIAKNMFARFGSRRRPCDGSPRAKRLFTGKNIGGKAEWRGYLSG